MAATVLGVTTPVVAQVPHITQIAAGASHTCALEDTGKVWCWGMNSRGQLGDGTNENRSAPTVIVGLKGVIGISLGKEHSCATLDNGRVFCWGSNSSGQLGDGTFQERHTPVEVKGLRRVTSVALGEFHSCALSQNRRVYCWGNNFHGQLGDGTTTGRNAPVRVVRLRDVEKISIGNSHGCARVQGGTVRCWGYNHVGQLGDMTRTNRSEPVRVRLLRNVVKISLGASHSCARLENGRMRCWGGNWAGQLGDGTTGFSPLRVTVRRIQGAAQIALGWAHSCAQINGQRVACWGDNSFGQLGDGTTTRRSTRLRVPGLRDVAELELGWWHSCVLLTSGRIRCWGYNWGGQLGDGTTVNRLTPVDVVFPAVAETPLFPISGFDGQNLAVMTDGVSGQPNLNVCYAAHGGNWSVQRPLRYFRNRYHMGVDIRTWDLPPDAPRPAEIRAPVDGEIVFYRAPNSLNTFFVLSGSDGHDYIFAHVACDTNICSLPTDTWRYPPDRRTEVVRGQRLGQVLPSSQGFDEHLHFGVTTRRMVDNNGRMIREESIDFITNWWAIRFGTTEVPDPAAARDIASIHGFIDPATLWVNQTGCECLYATDDSFCPQQ